MSKSAQPVTAYQEKFEDKLKRFEELEQLLADPAVFSNSQGYPSLAREHGSLNEFACKYRLYKELVRKKEETEGFLEDASTEDEFKELAREDLDKLENEIADVLEQVKRVFLAGTDDTRVKVIMEIRAGTGGEEAALFAADLFKMYSAYARRQGWSVELIEHHGTERGGFREVIMAVQGKGCFGMLKHEYGGHRVQRVPETETQGRIHTSAVTVAVLPEVEEVEVNIDEADLRVDTFRSSGPGGQSVNKLSSAVRMTHVPTGIVVSCQDEKSQHKNRAKAMRILRSRIFDFYDSRIRAERDQTRRTQIGSGDRSQRIRTYNFPQSRVTDHRINLSLYNLDRILLGELDELTNALVAHERDRRLTEL